MNVCGFGFTLQCAFKHFLRRYKFSTIQFNYSAIVEGISITRKYAFRSQARIGNGEIGARAGRYFRNLEVFVQKGTKLITRFTEAAAGEFLVRALE